MGDATVDNFLLESGRWFHPIGPAPKNWKPIPGCARTIPHNDEPEQWMNDEMNADHSM